MIRTTSETMKLPPTRLILRNFDQFPTNKTADQHVEQLLDIFIRSNIKKAGGNLKTTRYWLNLQHPAYVDGDGFWIIHKTYAMANGHTLINIIADHNQSKPELGLDETLVLSMRVFTREKKKGRGGRIPDQILKQFGLKSPNVVGSTHCLPKALAIGKLWSDVNSCEVPEEKDQLAKKLNSLLRTDVLVGSRRILQLTEAYKLLRSAGMDLDEEDHNMDDLEELAAHLVDYRICVWTMETGVAFPTIIFDENKNAEGFIPIFFENEHYEFFVPKCSKVKHRFCFNCHKLAKDRHWKTCKALCKRCGLLNCLPGVSTFCERCSIWFHSAECYNAHLRKRSGQALPFCERYEKCHSCSTIHERNSYSRSQHKCHHPDFCNICMEKMSGKHDCSYAAPTPASRKRNEKKQEQWTMVIYDCESIVTSSAEYIGISSTGIKHVPNTLAYRLICNKCMGNYCPTCGDMQVFSYKLRPGESGSVIERFSKFLKTDPRLKNAYVIAHNGGRYDHVFTLEEMMREEAYDPNFTMTGTTFITADVRINKTNTIHFRDSVRYMPMRLSQLPDAFELETKAKGHFPYMFNHPENYEPPLHGLPPIEYYEPQFMSTKERGIFEKWYEENKHKDFDFEKEIVEYCKNDVQILMEAVVKFIKTCQEKFNGWNPIIQSPTLASYVQFVMKYEHIKTGDIGNIPENGWYGGNNSKFALKYLLWLEHKNPELNLQHKLKKGGEHFVSGNRYGRHVDGYNEATNEVFEIHGCMWHGCDKCYLDRAAPCPGEPENTMDELFNETMLKDEDIRASGYTLHVKWECELREEMQKNREMADFFKNCHYAHQLFPREAMYGGRTQQFKSLAKANHLYSIEYFDFCSLYPFINIKGTMYPRGVPERITEKFATIVPGEPLPYRGLVFCDILPPLFLLLPILPFRANGKLLFPLCRSCAISKKAEKCSHFKASQRYLTGVWCTDELNLAIKHGYRIQKYHEVWDWEEGSWFRGGFFESFMAPLLKMKHEASGWPRNDMSEDEKQSHVDTILENDGVQLDKEHIKKNPAMRSLAKLFLNSTWGKFAQNPSKTETKLIPISKALEASNFISATGYEPKCFEEWGDSHILVSRKPVKEALKTSKFTNIVYGALTTSAARIKLYEAMEKVGAENMIYCDTDSVIFLQKRGENALGSLRGDALGQMTNETPSGWVIDEIVAMAPKVYTLKMVHEDGSIKYSTKAKGITLNSETADKINFETMKRMMEERLRGEEESFIIKRMRMKRGSNILDGLETVIEPKRLRPVMDKGTFDEEGVLTPFGLLNEENAENIHNDYAF